MANGFPEGNFRIINKETGACISSLYGGQTHGLQDAVTARGETGVLPYSHTNDREFTVHDKVKNIEEELWYFDSHADGWGRRVNMLYNKVTDIRSSWALGARVETDAIAYKLLYKDLENFLNLLPKQDEETLAHLKTSDCLDIVGLLETFIHSNGEENIKSELVGKLDETKLNEYLNAVLAHESIRRIEQKFHEYASSPWLFLNIPELKGLSENPFAQHNEQLYKIILAAVQLDVLDQKDWTTRSEFRLHLRHDNIDALLKNMKKESMMELHVKAYKEYENTQDLKKEAVKVLLELRKTLDLHTNEKNMDTVKKILKVSLKSNESFEQLQTALNSTNGKELKPVNWHSGDVFLQGAGRQYQTKWAFEDGYIFVEGQPDAVLTHLWGSSVGISQRSNDPKQRWELK
ncbi:hypothetical protein MWMV17_MWMV17_01660 [Acinetobacter calcoaceticus]|uniref:Uncharacterized protein n=1 Tax=Acinetobacter calcoaceticus DSM 30006 = CIP 81.8 TaxID=981331 RepID=A0ABN0KCL5_ACICA|nr:hypothetical protein [Acinetobacter calcoaceticus]ENV94892.1 hypothetical protein F937_00999 [Acinetobacter calcoaceticus ANC 3680]ENW02048.1 hypothetical protein F936_00408 [Acinetobacter calcoaceticus DSM 30006 = CIP 81.8]CAI3132117.1 hypothetical protein MWMV17_MWMV17_01660 [Acinetobacter calcoaceticus]SUU66530.1 Uncharacterised protein [Acinetobacter calcoaceticus]